MVVERSRRRELADATRLALVPAGVALVLGLLLAPRRSLPADVPLPLADARTLSRIVAGDGQLATTTRAHPLPGAVRVLGSAIRAFHTLEAAGGDARALGDARRAVDRALLEALQGKVEDLVALRAVELEGFIDEVRGFERTGAESDELRALAGGFIRSMTAEGWCEGHTLVPTADVIRVMFKQMWNSFLGLESRPELALSLDEERLVYAFYLSHAHPSKAMREAIAAARRGAHDAKACAALVEAERAAAEAWRLERIVKLAALDADYPLEYARGVVRFRRGEYGASVDAFRKWIFAHPEGPLSLRAQNYLRAAADADRLQ